MKTRTTAKIMGSLMAAFLALGSLHAAEIKLKPAQTRIITLAEKPGTIIVSHPEFVSVQMIAPSKMLIQGLAAGYTNLLVLSKKGEKVADLDITITNRGDKRFVRVYQAGERATFVCAPECAPAPNMNDSARALLERNLSVQANQSLAKAASENTKGLSADKDRKGDWRRPQ